MNNLLETISISMAWRLISRNWKKLRDRLQRAIVKWRASREVIRVIMDTIVITVNIIIKRNRSQPMAWAMATNMTARRLTKKLLNTVIQNLNCIKQPPTPRKRSTKLPRKLQDIKKFLISLIKKNIVWQLKLALTCTLLRLSK